MDSHENLHYLCKITVQRADWAAKSDSSVKQFLFSQNDKNFCFSWGFGNHENVVEY